MTGQQLKNSILQMAVQGKLVPQDPTDEPASVLLERIRAEKEQLIKEGKIKREKNPSRIFRGADNLPYEQVGKNEPVCIADEVPFDIPESWEWVRLGEIGITNIGLTYKPSDKVDNGGTPVLRSNNIQNGKIELNDVVYVSCDVPERATIEKGDILICARNGSRNLVGKSAIIEEGHFAFGAFMAKYTSHLNKVLNPYILLFLESPVFRNQLDGVKTETINQITQDTLKNQLFPLPPLSEQVRIISKLSELAPQIDKYRTTDVELRKLNTSFPEQLKKSILQQAVQGKLVPQDENNEPASALLERIREEKQKLIKAGKIKKDKNESVIFRRDNSHYEKLNGIERCIDDEIPFEIPENWAWCRLGKVYQHNTGKALNSSNKNGTPLTYITTSNLYWNRFELDNLKEMLFTENEIDKCTVTKGDLLICEGGDIGRTAIWNYDFPIRIQNHIHRLRPYINVSSKFYYYIFYLYKNSGMIAGKGIGIQGLSAKALHNILIPLPPIVEQDKIVSVIENLLPYCEKL